jgi:hypothetical protein
VTTVNTGGWWWSGSRSWDGGGTHRPTTTHVSCVAHASGAGDTTGGLGGAGAHVMFHWDGDAQVAAGAGVCISANGISTVICAATWGAVITTTADVIIGAALYPAAAIGCGRRWIEDGREASKAGR